MMALMTSSLCSVRNMCYRVGGRGRGGRERRRKEGKGERWREGEMEEGGREVGRQGGSERCTRWN